jgi:DNA-binding PadR family transcriptional regulator
VRFSHHSRHHEGRGREHGHGHRFGPRGFFQGMRHGGRWGEEGEGRRGRRRRVFDGSELRLVLLKLIADQPRHGYELIRAIEELTGGAYVPSPGVVYPTLTLLQDMEQIEEAASEGPRKPFAITPKGTAELAAKKAEIEALFARLAALAGERERTDAGPVRRAMGNLRSVLMDRLRRDGVSDQKLYDVADIIDEAARKIERLQ